jgi:hypothetical protein
VAEVREAAAEAAAEASAAAGMEAAARAEEEAAAAAAAAAAKSKGGGFFSRAGGSGAGASDAAAAAAIARLAGASPGAWSKLSSSPPDNTVRGKAPRGRYSHAAANVGGNVFVVGGNGSGRLLGDVHVLDVANMRWSAATTTIAKATSETETETNAAVVAFSPRAGHAAVVWGSRVLFIGGHVKGAATDTCDVWMLDTGAMEWQRLALAGAAPPPCARGGHTATMVDGTNEVVVFGGEDRRGRLLDDVHVIDLVAMAWVTPGKGGVKGCAPTPRKGHVAGRRALTPPDPRLKGA